VFALAGGSISIQPQGACTGEMPPQFLFHFLCPGAEMAYIAPAAGRADSGVGLPVVTVMAAQRGGAAVELQGYIAGGAAHDMTGADLDPAGPAARSAAALWWGMSIFAGLVLLTVVLLWFHASRRGGSHRDEGSMDKSGDARRGRHWILGGGVILPVSSIAVLLYFGIPAGQVCTTAPYSLTPT